MLQSRMFAHLPIGLILALPVWWVRQTFASDEKIISASTLHSDLQSQQKLSYVTISGIIFLLGAILTTFKLSNRTLRATRNMMRSLGTIFRDMGKTPELEREEQLMEVIQKISTVETQLDNLVEKTNTLSIVQNFLSRMLSKESESNGEDFYDAPQPPPENETEQAWADCASPTRLISEAKDEHKELLLSDKAEKENKASELLTDAEAEKFHIENPMSKYTSTNF